MAEKSFSADVALSLEVAGQQLALSHVGPDELIVQQKCSPISAQEGILTVRIDDHTNVTRVRLIDPITGAGSRVGIERLSAVQSPASASASA